MTDKELAEIRARCGQGRLLDHDEALALLAEIERLRLFARAVVPILKATAMESAELDDEELANYAERLARGEDMNWEPFEVECVRKG